jgi:hypothetical protein
MAQKFIAIRASTVRSAALIAVATALSGCAAWLDKLARVPVICAVGVKPIVEGDQIVFAPILRNQGIDDTWQSFEINYNVIGRSPQVGHVGAKIIVPPTPPIVGTHLVPGVRSGPDFVVSPALLPSTARVPNLPNEYEISYEVDPTEAAFIGANRNCRASGKIIYRGTQFVPVVISPR